MPDPARTQILRTYLSKVTTSDPAQGASTRHAAKEAITQLLLPTNLNDRADGLEDVEAASSAILDLVQTEYIVDSRDMNLELDALAELIHVLKQRVKKHDYEVFGWAVRAHWNYDDSKLSGTKLSFSQEKWRVLNSLVARAANFDETLLLNGLWILRAALEDEDNVEANLPAAVQWIQQAGTAMYSSKETFQTEGQKNDPSKPGRKFTGQSGFSRERWDFWKSSFRGYTTSEHGAHGILTTWAKRAVQLMEKVENRR